MLNTVTAILRAITALGALPIRSGPLGPAALRSAARGARRSSAPHRIGHGHVGHSVVASMMRTTTMV
jgi:hypothetical protein